MKNDKNTLICRGKDVSLFVYSTYFAFALLF